MIVLKSSVFSSVLKLAYVKAIHKMINNTYEQLSTHFGSPNICLTNRKTSAYAFDRLHQSKRSVERAIWITKQKNFNKCIVVFHGESNKNMENGRNTEAMFLHF